VTVKQYGIAFTSLPSFIDAELVRTDQNANFNIEDFYSSVSV
jgi:hypothetical protein